MRQRKAPERSRNERTADSGKPQIILLNRSKQRERRREAGLIPTRSGSGLLSQPRKERNTRNEFLERTAPSVPMLGEQRSAPLHPCLQCVPWLFLIGFRPRNQRALDLSPIPGWRFTCPRLQASDPSVFAGQLRRNSSGLLNQGLPPSLPGYG